MALAGGTLTEATHVIDGAPSTPVGGELPIVPQPHHRRVIAVIQPSQIRILAKVPVKDKDARGAESVDNSRGTDLPVSRRRTRGHAAIGV